jgi:DNA-binding XRE family transcriptional regulator
VAVVDWWRQLRDYRLQAGITQEEAGRALGGLSRQTIGRIESGNYPVKMHVVVSMLVLYGVDWRVAFSGVDLPVPDLEEIDRLGAEQELKNLMAKLTPEELRTFAAIGRVLHGSKR